MRKVLLFTLFLALISTSAIVSYFSVTGRVYPHTYLGRSNVGELQSQDVEKLLNTAYQKSLTLQIQDRAYPLTYRQLGILIDKKTTVRMLFENNTLSFPGNILKYMEMRHSQKMVLPSLVFTQDYANFIEKSVFDFTTQKDVVQVDNANKTLILTDNEKKYRIDGEDLRALLTFHFGDKTATFEPKLIQITDGQKQQTVEEKNRQIRVVFSAPLNVVVQDSGYTSVSFSPDDLKKMFGIEWGKDEVSFVPAQEVISYWIDAKVDPVIPRSKQIDKTKLKQDVISSFLARAKGGVNGPVLVKTSVKEPTVTHGEIAERYIEVNISQQKMFLFYQGQMVKSYPISTGLYYPTPTGHFNIMNKSPEGYSDIFNVYMPWWMAFYYGWAGGQDAYFGIHELPYWYVGSEKKQRPREFLGSPHTGGCVSLDIGAAKEVYDFSYVGMDVVIYP